MKNKQQQEKFLKGVLKEDANQFTLEFTASHQFDRRLFKQDIAVSLVHIKMLKGIGLLNGEEYQQLRKALLSMKEHIAQGNMEWRDELEDIHMHIEAGITERIGSTGRKLHPGRSRNDQVATDVRLYLREETDNIIQKILKLRKVLAERAEEYHATLMPGFTHLQPAQPITFGHHLLAWQEMLKRDQERFIDCRKRINHLPMGAAALAGTSFPVDRDFLMQELGFDAPMQNSLDAVSARDFALEFAAVAAICMQHLSRWSEELILWCSPQFNFVELPTALCTGSSIMPQKKNPDLPELVRGKSGRVFGNLFSLLTLMKGQPLAYNKDNQEDKEPLFDSVRTLSDCLTTWQLLVQSLEVNAEQMRAALSVGHINATCIAEYLTEKGVPFREAYATAGAAVRLAIEEKKLLQELQLEQLQRFSPLIKEDIFPRLDYAKIVASYDLPGGSAPKRVKQAAGKALRDIKKQLP